MKKSKATAVEVRTALDTYLKACQAQGEQPEDRSYQITQILEAALGVSYSELRRWDVQEAQTRFAGQVRRALVQLASEGVLIKRGDRNNIRYYTPEVAAQHDAAAEQRRQDRATTAERRDNVSQRLQALELDVYRTAPGGDIRLEPDAWEKLLDLAEKGLTA